jgi:hypothetical protein
MVAPTSRATSLCGVSLSFLIEIAANISTSPILQMYSNHAVTRQHGFAPCRMEKASDRSLLDKRLLKLPMNVYKIRLCQQPIMKADVHCGNQAMSEHGAGEGSAVTHCLYRHGRRLLRRSRRGCGTARGDGGLPSCGIVACPGGAPSARTALCGLP